MIRTTLFLLSALILRAQALVIQTGTLLDGRGGVAHSRQMVIEGSKIRSVAAGAAKADIDLRGLTVMPGWIDTHIHLNWHLDAENRSVSSGARQDEMALATAGDAY